MATIIGESEGVPEILATLREQAHNGEDLQAFLQLCRELQPITEAQRQELVELLDPDSKTGVTFFKLRDLQERQAAMRAAFLSSLNRL